MSNLIYNNNRSSGTKKIEVNSEHEMFLNRFIELCSENTPKYFIKMRGYDEELIKSLSIGECNDDVYNQLREEFGLNKLKETGFISKKNRIYKDRVIFPFNSYYFSARSQDSKTKPKYKNLFPKKEIAGSKKPYYLNGDNQTLIMCEGETDAIALKHIFPKHNIIGVGGVQTATAYIEKIPPQCEEIIVCFDNDEAGMKTKDRIISLLLNLKVKIKIIEFDNKYKDIDDLFRKYGDNTIQNFKIIDNEDIRSNFKKAIVSFLDYKDMAEQFYKIQPIYFDKSKIWFIWNYQINKWEMVDETDIFILVDEALEQTMINTTKGHIKSEIIEALRRIGRRNKPLNPSINWIQFKNYVYDIKTREKFKPTPRYFFTNPINWDLGNVVETPVMDKLFEEWVGEDYVEMLYEIIAYCLYRDYPIHRIFCLIGSGRNGKSKFIELINRFICKDNSASTELDQLLLSRFEVAKLYKKLVCCMGETNYNALEKTALLKKLTGQDLIGYEFKQKNPFDDYNYAKILISTNSIPVTHDKTDGFYRRWLVIDFPNKFPEGKDILKTIPDEEYENLALKSVVILKMLLEEGKFTNESSIDEKKEIYEEKSNPLSKFLKENIVENLDEYVYKYDFYAVYSKWLTVNGYRVLTKNQVGSEMKHLFEDNKKGSDGYWAWLGFMWKKDVAKEEVIDETDTTAITDTVLT